MPVAKKSLSERLKSEVAAKSAPSMIPEAVAPPPKEEEIVPDIKDLIPNPKDRLQCLRLVQASVSWQAQESEAKKERKPITAALKAILGKYKVGKALADGVTINYFNTPRRTLSVKKLLEHGVSPNIIEDCYEEKDSYTLRIGAGEKEEE